MRLRRRCRARGRCCLASEQPVVLDGYAEEPEVAVTGDVLRAGQHKDGAEELWHAAAQAVSRARGRRCQAAGQHVQLVI